MAEARGEFYEGSVFDTLISGPPTRQDDPASRNTDPWMTGAEIEALIGVSYAAARRYGLAPERIVTGVGGRPNRKSRVLEWRDGLAATAKQLK